MKTPKAPLPPAAKLMKPLSNKPGPTALQRPQPTVRKPMKADRAPAKGK